MYIGELTGLIPAKFECSVAADGELVTREINMKLRRLPFKEAIRADFIETFQNVQENPEAVGRLLAGYTEEDGTEHKGLIAEWELFEDPECTRMLPITCENIVSQPPDFVWSILNTISEKLTPNPQKATSSPNGSEAPDRSDAATTSESDTNSRSLVASGE